jgi:hypothetical protein
VGSEVGSGVPEEVDSGAWVGAELEGVLVWLIEGSEVGACVGDDVTLIIIIVIVVGVGALAVSCWANVPFSGWLDGIAVVRDGSSNCNGLFVGDNDCGEGFELGVSDGIPVGSSLGRCEGKKLGSIDGPNDG